MSSQMDNLRYRVVELKMENATLRRDNKLLLSVRDAARGVYHGSTREFDRNRAISIAIEKFDNRKKLEA